MGLFKKKSTATEGCCSCMGATASSGESQGSEARVKVYGTGCKKCHALYESAVAAAGRENVEYITDAERVAASGVLSLPALVIDGKVASAGTVPSPEEIARMLRSDGSCGCC